MDNFLSMAVNGSYVFAGTGGSGVFVSSSNGTNWNPADSGLTNLNINGLAVDGSSTFAGTNNGVFLSTNYGTTWHDVSTGLTAPTVYAFAVSSNAMGGEDLYAGTYHGGVWKRPITEMVTSVRPSVIVLPKLFRLEQNYPNPFNPTTTIHYELPKESFVRLSVFDLLGRRVRTLVNQTETPGYKSVQFDGSNLASGLYFYQVTVGTFQDNQCDLEIRSIADFHNPPHTAQSSKNV
jgi:hypothetical protein